MTGSVAPNSTTAKLAGEVPNEKAPIPEGSSDLPGSFPETPALMDKEFSINPLPATDGAVNPTPGAHASDIKSNVTTDKESYEKSGALGAGESNNTFGVAPLPAFPGGVNPTPGQANTDTIHSNVTTDKAAYENSGALGAGESEQTFGVAPLPAFPGAVNPTKLAPGEKVPDESTLTANTIHSNVTTDKASYENSGALGNAPFLPPVVTPQAERDANGTGVLDLPPISNNMIPESSLPMGAATGGYDASPFIQSSGAQSTTNKLAGLVPNESSKVPEVVKESQAEAGVGPEASAVPSEVQEKSAVEKELLKEVPVAPTTAEGTAGKATPDKTEVPATTTASEAASAVGAAALAVGGGAAAYASNAAGKLPESVTSKLPASLQNSISNTVGTTTAKDTPEIVKESIAKSGESPEAAANEEAVLEKKAVESELLKEIKPETSTGESAPTPAPPAKDTPSAAEVAPATPAKSPAAAALSTPSKSPESRDVSPGTVPGSHTEQTPAVTTGVASSSTTPVSTPAKSVAGSSKVESPSTADKKKKNRNSFFGKLKAKFDKKTKE